MKNENKTSAAQDGRQFKSNQDIILEVANLLLQNRDMSYFRAQDILRATINYLGSTPIIKD